MTAAQETLTNSLQDGQKSLNQQKADAWLTASKALVNLDTESTIQRAQGLAGAIGELAGDDRVHVENGQSGYDIDNPFWVALAQKADRSAEYIADTKNAERLYYGRSPWSETVNGAVIDHMNGTRGVLDARRDFEIGMADAAATQNKALQHSIGLRDRELADAGLQLAQARSTYETDWANLNLESSNWKLELPTLPITGDVDGTISLTAGVGTRFVPGWFSVSLIDLEHSGSTSTGFSSLDLDYFFTSGLMPDMPDTDPVTTGKVSRNDSWFTTALNQPAGQDGNETVTPAPEEGQISVVADANVAHEPPAPIALPVIGIVRIPEVRSEIAGLLGRPTAPGQFDNLLPGDWTIKIDPGLSRPDRFKGTPFDRALWGGEDWPTSTVDNDAHLDGNGVARGRRPLLTPDVFDEYEALDDDLALADLLSASGAFGQGFAKGFFSDGLGGLWDTIAAIPGFVADASDYTSSSLAYSWHWLWGNQESADNTRAGTFWKEAGDSLNELLDSPLLAALQADFAEGGGYYTGNWRQESLDFFEATESSLYEIKRILEDAIAELDHLSLDEKSELVGRVLGAIVFEVGLTVASGSAGLAAKSGKLGKILDVLNLSPAARQKLAIALAKFQDNVKAMMNRKVASGSHRLDLLMDAWCFSPETPVATNRGSKSIGEIEPGEHVHSFDFKAGEYVLSEVLQRHQNQYSGQWVSIAIGEETIELTANHPLWIVTGESLADRPTPTHLDVRNDEKWSLTGRWINSQDVRRGDVMCSRTGGDAVVESVRVSEAAGRQVCNLTVRGNHTFLVGRHELLAHNESWCDIMEKKFNWAKPQALIAMAQSHGFDLSRIHGHHIVMKAGGGIYGYKARKILERFGIDVIYDKSTLKNMSPKDLHNLAMAMNNYRGINSDAYAEAVWRRLQDVIDLSNSKGWSKKRIKEALQDALSRMRRDLEEGKVFWPET